MRSRALGPSTFEVRTVTDSDEFAELQAAWDALAVRGHIDSPFLIHAWFEAAWQWRRESASLLVLCFFRDGSLAAALPLVVTRRSVGGMLIRELAYLAIPDTQMCDIVVADDDRATAIIAFADALYADRSNWDFMRIDFVRAQSQTAAELRAALATRGFDIGVDACAENPFVSLTSNWEAYYGTRSRRLKKANNLAANRLGKLGNVRIDWLEPGSGTEEDAARVVSDACAISARSWKAATDNSLDNPGPAAFIRRLSGLAHRRGWLSVWILRLDGLPIAMEYQLVAGGRVYALRSDFDAGIEEQASPGSYLSRQLIERLFGRGYSHYFMGPGGNPYKYRWNDGAEPLVRMTVYGHTVRGRVLRLWEMTLKPIARTVRDRLRRATATDAPAGVGPGDGND
jgi:CelD/BcsL family acetyltransferase involved in cellulose biosynthesis